jgi:translation initiation factor IF-3
LVGDNVEPGVYPTAKALKIARRAGIGFVVISDKAEPYICRILDYKKFFTSKRKNKRTKSQASKSSCKRNRFGPQTDDHDYEFKKNMLKNSWKKVLN